MFWKDTKRQKPACLGRAFEEKMSALGKNKLFPGKKDISEEEETLCSFNTSGKEALQKATLSCTGPK